MDLDDLLDDIPLPPSTSTSAGNSSKAQKGKGKGKAIEDMLDKVELSGKPSKNSHTKAKAKASDTFVSERKKAQDLPSFLRKGSPEMGGQSAWRSAMGANVDVGNPPPKVPLPHSRAYQSFYTAVAQPDDTEAQKTILQKCYGRALSSACKAAGTQEPPASATGNEPAVKDRLMKMYIKVAPLHANRTFLLLAKDLKGIGSHPDFDSERYPETASKIVAAQ